MLPTNDVLETIKNNKNSPELFHNIRSATKRIRQGQPTADDYRLIMKYPAMAHMFLRNK
jgi:hypothetical protein